MNHSVRRRWWLPASHAAAYSSGSQRARVVTESWAEQNLYCPNCSSATLSRQTHNTRAFDFRCPTCRFDFQLKGQKTPFRSSITDGAYRAMMDAVQNDALPSFYFLHYEILTSPSPLRSGGEGWGEEAQFRKEATSPRALSPKGGEGVGASSQGERAGWVVRNLLLVPHFAFPPSAIIKRPPLSPTARRAGWIGCNFDLRRIPVDARIEIVRTVAPSSPPFRTGERIRGEVEQLKSPLSGSRPAPKSRGERVVITPVEEVREKFRRVKPLKEISVEKRGWMLDILNVVRRLGKTEFTNQDVYAFERELEKLHPDNRHIRDKIRQQLQVLRDLGLLHHVDRNRWRVS